MTHIPRASEGGFEVKYEKSLLQVDEFMKQQGCESTERGKFVNKCLVDGGHTEGNRSDILMTEATRDHVMLPGL